MPRFEEVFPAEVFDKGLPSELIRKIVGTLSESEVFESDKALRDFIKECPNLSPWKSTIQEASSPRARAELLVANLHNKKHSVHGNALLIFLSYLAEKKGHDFSGLKQIDGN